MTMDPLRWNSKVLLVVAASLAAVLGLLIFTAYRLNAKTLVLTMRGEENVRLAVGTPYSDPGAEAHYSERIFRRNDTDVDVEVRGCVDVNTPGTYRLTYVASHNDLTERASRTIEVFDAVAPTITLTTDPDAYTLPGERYAEEGFSALDNVDGDLTASVISREEGGKVYYRVTDAAGNTAEAVRTIRYDDRDAPVITLGDVPLEVYAGDGWEDSFSAEDNVLGDVTDRVTFDPAVDPDTPGTYEITYSATDDYGNTGTATRTVVIRPLPQNDPSRASSGKRIVYLTFDDGPGPHTERLLDVLAKYNVKASFFVTAQQRSYLNLLGREASEGHLVAVHTYSHNYEEIYENEAAYWADFDRINAEIAAHTGSPSRIFRFPGGSSNMVSAFNEGIMSRLAAQAAEKGYDYYDWNVSSGDAEGIRDPENIRENILAGIRSRNVSVVLCHDMKSATVDAMEQLFRISLEEGYTYLPLSYGCTNCRHTIRN